MPTSTTTSTTNAKRKETRPKKVDSLEKPIVHEDEIKEKSILSKHDYLNQEDDDGHIEYKWKLVNISDERFKHLVTQMSYRLSEGQGEAIYELGIKDNGFPEGLDEDEFNESVETIKRMATELHADVSIICQKEVTLDKEKKGKSSKPSVMESIEIPIKDTVSYNTTSTIIGDNIATVQENTDQIVKKKKVAELLVRKFGDEQYMDLRIAVCGNVDSGKSTLIGVLTRGQLDNGRGLARANVFLHKHEIDTGRTSSVSHQIMGYDSKGSIVNYGLFGTPSWKEIIEKSAKVCTFIDLAGHEKYLKTTVYGMTGNIPDYACVVVGANMGVTRMTKEHLGLCLALKIPIFICVTKIDICPENILKQTLDTIHKILKLPGVRKLPYHIKNEDDVLTCSKNIASDRIAPIFMMSSVTGHHMDLLRKFINLLPVRRDWETLIDKPAEFVIDQTFFVTGVGTVVSGIVLQGSISINDTLMLGPDGNGQFRSVAIKSIHCKRVNVRRVHAGQSATFALKKEKRSGIRKGMVMVEPKFAKATWEFEAEVLVLYHSTTIKENYQPVIHCSCVRQCAKIIKMNSESLRTGDKATVKFRFMFRPEYIRQGERLIFREGRTKGLGIISKVF
jgi:GTPase